MLDKVIFLLAPIVALSVMVHPANAISTTSAELIEPRTSEQPAVSENFKKIAQVQRRTSPASRTQDQLLRGQNKVDANAGTVTIITARNIGAPFMVAALNLSTLLDAGERFEIMRVIPVIARGKVQNLWDILYLKGIDIGFVQTDVLEYLKGDPQVQSIKNRIRYITQMFPAEVHIVARKEIKSLKDLAGKTVSINAKGTGSSVVGTLLFRRLGIKAKLIHADTGRAIARMKKGEISAHFNVLGKPARPIVRIKRGDGLHLLPIPYTKEVSDIYLPSSFTSKDYPEIIEEGQTIPTIAAGNVLAVFNWPEDGPRYKKVSRFVKAFFAKFGELKKPGFHPKWKDVNLYASVPGWTRFKAAQEWLDANRQVASPLGREKNLREQFKRFLTEQGIFASSDSANSDSSVLFKKFIEWQDTH